MSILTVTRKESETDVSTDVLSKKELLQLKKKKHRKKKLYIIIAFAVTFVFLMVAFFWIPFFHIRTVSISGTETINSSELERYVLLRTQGTFLGIVPKKNVFLIHKKTLEQAIQSFFPHASTVKINKHFTSLRITITERERDAVWCSSLDSEAVCYSVDTEGVIYEIAGKASNPLFFVYDTPVLYDTEPILKSVLPKEAYTRIEQIRQNLQHYTIPLYGYSLHDENEEIFYLSPIRHNEPSSFIKTQTKQDTESIVSHLVTALKSDVLSEQKATYFSGLEYIDLRFDGKVFYKLTSSTDVINEIK